MRHMSWILKHFPNFADVRPCLTSSWPWAQVLREALPTQQGACIWFLEFAIVLIVSREKYLQSNKRYADHHVPRKRHLKVFDRVYLLPTWHVITVSLQNAHGKLSAYFSEAWPGNFLCPGNASKRLTWEITLHFFVGAMLYRRWSHMCFPFFLLNQKCKVFRSRVRKARMRAKLLRFSFATNQFDGFPFKFRMCKEDGSLRYFLVLRI